MVESKSWVLESVRGWWQEVKEVAEWLCDGEEEMGLVMAEVMAEVMVKEKWGKRR